LVVDDDQSTRKMLKRIFQNHGYDTETAETGHEAIDKARDRFFSLALLDVKLPDMNGTDLASPLKETHPDMVVIMISAFAFAESAARAVNDGASAYILKPMLPFGDTSWPVDAAIGFGQPASASLRPSSIRPPNESQAMQTVS